MPSRPWTYVNFESFRALAAQASIAESLVELYRNAFGSAGAWNETYTRAEVLEKLETELAGTACLRVCLQDEQQVAGFCWAQALDALDIIRSIGTIKYYQTVGMPDLTRSLRQVIGDECVIYVHDLAIGAECRGRVPMTELIYPVLCSVASRSDIDQVLFWSVANTLMERFARRAKFERRMSVDGMDFHLGRFGRVQGEHGESLRWRQWAPAYA